MKKRTHSGASVSAEQLLASLEDVAEKIRVHVRYENITGGPIKTASGSCRIRGEDVILIDRRLSALEKTHALAQELRRFDLEGVFISPAVRNFLQNESSE